MTPAAPIPTWSGDTVEIEYANTTIRLGYAMGLMDTQPDLVRLPENFQLNSDDIKAMSSSS